LIWMRQDSLPPVPGKKVIPALRNVPTTLTGDAGNIKELATCAMCPDWTFTFPMRFTRAICRLGMPNVDTSRS
jgi:hypothetical protein